MFDFLKQPKGFYKGVVALMGPMMLQNMIAQTVALTDTFMVGMLGERYLAAVTMALTPLFFLLILTLGVQSGVGILSSQYWGKGNLNAINRVMGIGIYTALTMTLAGALAVFFFPHQILSIISPDRVLVELGVTYLRIAGFAQVCNAISLVYIASHRSMENPRLGVIILSISSVTSVFLNWVLIFGNLGFPALGIQGAAISTLIARGIEVVIICIHAFNNSRLKIQLSRLLAPGIMITKDFFKYSLPIIFNEALWGFGFMLFPVIFGHMAGAQTILAAFTIAGNIERFFSVAIFASGAATSVIIGREIGAGRIDNVKNVAKALTSLGLLFGVAASILILVTRTTIIEPFVYPLFDLSVEAAAVTSTMLLILAFAQPMRSLLFTIGLGVLRGGGDVKAFMIIDVGTLYLIALPIAAIAGLVIGADIAVVYSAFFFNSLAGFILCVYRMRSGKWINDVTRDNVN